FDMVEQLDIPNIIVDLGTPNPEIEELPSQPIPLNEEVQLLLKFGFDHSLIDQVDKANSPNKLKDILRLTIEDKIIESRFKAFNQDWRLKILPKMKNSYDEIRKRLKVAEKTDTSKDASWQTILTALENIMQPAENMKFSPPADRSWWETVAGKGHALDKINFSVKQELDQSIIIKGVTDGLVKTVADQRTAETNLKKELDRIQKSFDKFVEQQAGQMVGLPEQFGGIPIDLI
ncbi:MAG: hypothetical protein GY931_14905, partial [Maribacter sp.]|nr:hypothetical protein [Maribacter sp.]